MPQHRTFVPISLRLISSVFQMLSRSIYVFGFLVLRVHTQPYTTLPTLLKPWALLLPLFGDHLNLTSCSLATESTPLRWRETQPNTALSVSRSHTDPSATEQLFRSWQSFSAWSWIPIKRGLGHSEVLVIVVNNADDDRFISFEN